MDALLQKLATYLTIPHELLHVVGYRLVGKACHYHWGHPYVIPLEPLARQERLIGLLFPFVVSALASLPLTAAFVAGLQYYLYISRSPWALLASLLCAPLAFFAIFNLVGSAGDLRQAYLLLFNKPTDSPTPLDGLWWPLRVSRAEADFAWLLLFLLLLLGLGYALWGR